MLFSTVHHPYIEKFIGHYESGDKFGILTQKSGQSLKSFINDDFVDNDDDENFSEEFNRTAIALMIAQAMYFLHSNNIIHRDLSANNIYIRKNEINDNEYEMFPVIANFANSHFSSSNSSLVNTRMRFDDSVSAFIAPELIDSSKYDESVDVFAFGGILFEMLTGLSPYSEIKAKQKDNADYYKEVNNHYRPTILANCPDRLRSLIEKCWDQKCENRPSFYEIIKMILPKEGEEMFIFSQDENEREVISQFYEKFAINSKVSVCLDYFENIKKSIKNSCQFRSVLFRAVPILTNYQYLLWESDFSSIKEMNDEENIKISNLEENLIKLGIVVSNALNELLFPDEITNQSVKKVIDQYFESIKPIPNDFKTCMDALFESMENLGVNVVERFIMKDEDLMIDYYQNYLIFESFIIDIKAKSKDSKRSEAIKFKQENMRCEEIKDEIGKILGKIDSNKIVISLMKALLSNYQEFQRKEYEFTKCQIISSGSTSLVYRGIDKKNNDNPVAIKVLKKEYLKFGEISLCSLSREIANLTSLKHKYIADFIGYVISEKESEIWIITKYYEFGSLYDINLNGYFYMDNVKIDIDGAMKTIIATKIAEVMDYIHSCGIINRDLKTSNILISIDKDEIDPKLIDFGSSRHNIQDVTKTNKAGTFGYMAGEVLKGNDYGPEADVFSYGIILWELYHGRPPYKGMSSKQIMDIKKKKCQIGNHRMLSIEFEGID